MRKKIAFWTVIFSLTFLGLNFTQAQEENTSAISSVKPATQILAHFMPWFEANAEEEKWGWHLTMNNVDPKQLNPDGQRKIATAARKQLSEAAQQGD